MASSGHPHPIAISIHALRKESDVIVSIRLTYKIVISIHALRKESDFFILISNTEVRISIHALRKESDRQAWCRPWQGPYFNPRSP